MSRPLRLEFPDAPYTLILVVIGGRIFMMVTKIEQRF
jgi:hypothetical protein